MNNDFITGSKVIHYALSTLAWGVSCAVAWSCSTILMGIIMFIIMRIVMGLLMTVLNIALLWKLDSTTIESLGRNAGGAAARVTSMFSRKVPA